MDLLLILAAGIVAVLALLVARGMYLIGQGSDTELDARTKMSQDTLGSTGWSFLDMLRTTDFGPVVWLEDRLGLDSPGERCRHHGCTQEPVPGYQDCHTHLDTEDAK